MSEFAVPDFAALFAGWAGPILIVAAVSALILLLMAVAVALRALRVEGFARNSAEQALQESQLQLQLAQDAAGMGVVSHNCRTGTAWWGAAFARLLGLQGTAGTWGEVLERIHPNDRAALTAALQPLLTTGGSFRQEFRLRAVDSSAGAERWLALKGSIAAVAAGQGSPQAGVGEPVLRGVCYDISERKWAELALQKSEHTARAQLSELEALYANAPVGFAMLDTEFRFRRINSTLAEINGMPAEAHIGVSAWDIVPSLRGQAEPIMREVLATRRPIRGIPLKGETPREPGVLREWVEHFYPITGQDGAAIGLGIVVEEVTGQRRLEREAEEQQARVTRLLASNVVGIFTVDDTHVLEANDMFLDLVGYTREDLEAGRLNWRAMTPPAYEEADRQILAELHAEGTCTPFAKKFIRKDGDEVPVMIGATIFETEPKMVYVCLAVDMTDRERAEEAIRSSSSMLRLVIDNLITFVAVLTLEGKVIEVNRGPLELLGISRQDMVGQDLWDARPWAWSAAAQEVLRGAFRTALGGEVSRVDVTTRAAAGAELSLEFHIAPICDDNGRPTQVIASAVDVTDRKRREEHVSALLRELSHRSNNLLAVLGAIIRYTIRQSRDLEDFEQRFSARVHSLASAQALLVLQDWQGARLRDLVDAQIGYHISTDNERVHISGPDLIVTPNAAQHLGLAINELAANSSRYGALSVPGGEVRIVWKQVANVDGGADRDTPGLELSWHESGGPPRQGTVVKGYGHTVLERVVPDALNATAHYSLQQGEVHWHITMPAEVVVKEAVRLSAPPGRSTARPAPVLQ
jgi:PAS domain S-box-containing protein